MPDLTPDEVLRAASDPENVDTADGDGYVRGWFHVYDTSHDEAEGWEVSGPSLARQLLAAREALQEAYNHFGSADIHPEDMAVWDQVRACLPEYQEPTESLAEAARRAGEGMATLEEKRRFDMLTAATGEDLIGSIPHAPDGSALFRSEAAYTSQLHMIARALVAAAEAGGKDDPASRDALCRHARELLRQGVEQGYVPPSEPFAYFDKAPDGVDEAPAP